MMTSLAASALGHLLMIPVVLTGIVAVFTNKKGLFCASLFAGLYLYGFVFAQ